MKNGFLKDYYKKRALFSDEELEKYSSQLHEIKKKSIEHLQEMKNKVATSLKQNGVVVHEFRDLDNARRKIQEIIGKEKAIAKSKSNTVKSLGLEKLNVEINETDLGDFIAQLCESDSGHAVLPALGVDQTLILKRIKEKYGVDVEKGAAAITKFCEGKIRENILNACVGITGANAITSSGQIVLLENEGNISLLSRIPEKHIVVAGIEKIVPAIEDAMTVVKCASMWGTGQAWPTYVSIIDGPSKTADINNELVIGAQGAREVHVILLDNWQTEFSKGEFKEMLYCINCGACESVCPVFNTIGDVISIFDPELNYKCATCTSCKINCPAKIDWEKLTILARELNVKEAKGIEANKKMIEKIRKYGNPFGKIGDPKASREMYCC